MGVLDYRNASWSQSQVEVYGSGVYILVLGLVVWQLVQSMGLRSPNYNRRALVGFYISACLALTFSLLQFLSGPHLIPFPLPLYGLFSYGPPPLLTTASTCFLSYVTESLAKNFASKAGRRFKHCASVAEVFLAVFWPVTFVLMYGIGYQHYISASVDWFKVFFLVNSGVDLTVVLLLLGTITSYIQSLRDYAWTFRDKKSVVYFMLGTTILQLLCRIAYLVLVIMGECDRLRRISRELDIPYAQLLQVGYMLLCDVLLMFVYTLYLRKDMLHLIITHDIEHDDTHKYSIASYIEVRLSGRSAREKNALLASPAVPSPPQTASRNSNRSPTPEQTLSTHD